MTRQHLLALGFGVALLGAGTGYAQTAAPEQGAPKPAEAAAPPARGGTIDFKEVAFADAVDYLRDVTGLNISVNWRALEEAGVSKTDPVTLRLKNVTVRQVLKLMLQNVAPGKLAYSVDGNVLNITTLELSRKNMVTRIYHVEDLITDLPQFEQAPNFNLRNSGANGGQNGGGGGGGSNGLFDQQGGQGGQKQDAGKTREERAQELIDLITSTVERDVWDVNGGAATIRYFNGTLIVTAPRDVQAQIGK